MKNSNLQKYEFIVLGCCAAILLAVFLEKIFAPNKICVTYDKNSNRVYAIGQVENNNQSRKGRWTFFLRCDVTPKICLDATGYYDNNHRQGRWENFLGDENQIFKEEYFLVDDNIQGPYLTQYYETYNYQYVVGFNVDGIRVSGILYNKEGEIIDNIFGCGSSSEMRLLEERDIQPMDLTVVVTPLTSKIQTFFVILFAIIIVASILEIIKKHKFSVITITNTIVSIFALFVCFYVLFNGSGEHKISYSDNGEISQFGNADCNVDEEKFLLCFTQNDTILGFSHFVSFDTQNKPKVYDFTADTIRQKKFLSYGLIGFTTKITENFPKSNPSDTIVTVNRWTNILNRIIVIISAVMLVVNFVAFNHKNA